MVVLTISVKSTLIWKASPPLGQAVCDLDGRQAGAYALGLEAGPTILCFLLPMYYVVGVS